MLTVTSGWEADIVIPSLILKKTAKFLLHKLYFCEKNAEQYKEQPYLLQKKFFSERKTNCIKLLKIFVPVHFTFFWAFQTVWCFTHFHSGVTEDFVLKYDTVSVGDQVLMFWGNIVSSSWWSKVLEEYLVEHFILWRWGQYVAPKHLDLITC